MNRGLAVGAAFLAGLAACRPAAPEAPKPKYSAAQLAARFYMDLGPDAVDVSGYPKRQQEEYATFSKTCSQCHTLARPVNAPETSRADWELYVKRMHANTQLYGAKVPFGKAEAAEITDFLTYDAKARKLDKKEEFARQTERLKALFADVGAERDRLQVAQGKSEAHEPPPYVGDRPSGGK